MNGLGPLCFSVDALGPDAIGTGRIGGTYLGGRIGDSLIITLPSAASTRQTVFFTAATAAPASRSPKKRAPKRRYPSGGLLPHAPSRPLGRDPGKA